MNNSKKLYFLLLLLLLCAVLFLSVQIYAKYLSSASGNTEIAIARWNITVNTLSIKNNTDISAKVAPVFPGNSHIANDIIAPTAEGYFDLDLDFSAADVSFRYEITPSVDENSSVQDLIATGYSIDDGEKISFADGVQTISDTILLGSDVKTRKIRIYVLWDDSENASMSNAEDTTATNSETPALFHVDVSFTQITQ